MIGFFIALLSGALMSVQFIFYFTFCDYDDSKV